MTTKRKGGRPSGPKDFNNGTWTQARLNTFVRGLLRQGTTKWGPIQSTLRKASTRRGFKRCAGCGEEVPVTKLVGRRRVKNVFVDHIEPVVPVTGWVSWDDYIKNLFAEEDNLQVLCTDCHVGDKCKQEAAERAEHRRIKKENNND